MATNSAKVASASDCYQCFATRWQADNCRFLGRGFSILSPARGLRYSTFAALSPNLIIQFNRIMTHRTMRLLIFALILTRTVRAADDSPLQSTRRPSNIAVGSQVVDVELEPGGVLRGELRNAQGRLVPGSSLSIWKGGKLLVRSKTDDRGQFAFSGLEGGTYHIAAPFAQLYCRCWAKGTGPPRASTGLLLASQSYLLRGQQPIGQVYGYNPILMGAVVTAAVIVPIAVHDSDVDLPDGS